MPRRRLSRDRPPPRGAHHRGPQLWRDLDGPAGQRVSIALRGGLAARGRL